MADRTEDMGTDKRLRVNLDPEGDVHALIVTGRGMPLCDGAADLTAAVEFCASGCHSPRTRSALIALIAAMEEDERNRPDPHRPKGAIVDPVLSPMPQVIVTNASPAPKSLDEVVTEFAGIPQAMASAILQLRASLALAKATHADLLRKEGEFGGMCRQPDLPAGADDADRIARTVCDAISVVFVGFTKERRQGLESQAAGYIRAALNRLGLRPVPVDGGCEE